MLSALLQRILFGVSALARIASPLNAPLSAHIEINNSCNLDCAMCDRKAFYDKPIAMSFDQFRVAYDQVRPLVVSLHGYSEPLLHKDLLRIAEYVNEKGGNTNITTNLIPLKDADALVHSALDMVKISVDGTSKENFEATRGKNTFDAFMAKLDMLTEARKKCGRRTPFFRINFTITSGNFPEIPAVIDFAKQYDIDVVYFQTLLFNYNRVDSGQTKTPLLGPRQVAVFFEQGLARAGAAGIQTNLASILNQFPFIWRGYDKSSPFARPNNRRCLKPWSSVYISVNGDVKPCDRLGLTATTMGNVFRQSFDEIWHGEPYRKFRGSLTRGERPTQICQECLPPSLLDFINYPLFANRFK